MARDVRHGSVPKFSSFANFVASLPAEVAREEHSVLRPSWARLYRFSSQAALPDPAVPEVTIHLMTQGTVRYQADFAFGSFEGTKTPGQFDVVPPGTGGSFESDGAFDLLTLAVDWKRASAILRAATGREITDFGPLHARMETCPTVTELMLQMWRQTPDCPGARMFCEAAVTAILLRLLQLSDPGQTLPAPVRKGGLAPWQVKRVREYIEAELTRSLSVAELARICSLSPFHFARAFERSVGKPPYQYIIERRLARARRLMDETNEPLTEIAFRVGYAECSHLARAFKKAMGLSPSEYRRARQ